MATASEIENNIMSAIERSLKDVQHSQLQLFGTAAEAYSKEDFPWRKYDRTGAFKAAVKDEKNASSVSRAGTVASCEIKFDPPDYKYARSIEEVFYHNMMGAHGGEMQGTATWDGLMSEDQFRSEMRSALIACGLPIK